MRPFNQKGRTPSPSSWIQLRWNCFNGAGKSTAAPILLHDGWAIEEYVNADTIAAGLSAFQPERAAMTAGKLMLERFDALASRRASFAFETTLASKTLCPRIVRLRAAGYRIHLLFLALSSPELAMQRVAERVRLGGHLIPASAIHRRYHAGLENFFRIYQPICDSWRLFDNSRDPRLVARGVRGQAPEIKDPVYWAALKERYP